MSEIQNPIFDEEKEFLERKKLEYERALRGDVAHIKDQTEKVSKVALVGAGLAGSIWLITKAFSKKKRKSPKHRNQAGHDQDQDQDNEADYHDFGAEYDTTSKEQRYQSDGAHKSAADSAQVFMNQQEYAHEADDLGFGAAAPLPYAESNSVGEPALASYHRSSAARDFAMEDEEEFEDDPFQDLPYDDSRRLPTSHAFDGGSEAPAFTRSPSRSRMVGSVLKSFLDSDTGKVLVGQIAAVTLALVTKKVSEFFPTPKNSDLAPSPGKAPVQPGAYLAATPASSDSTDAFTSSQPS